MASTPVEFKAPTGLTLTLSLYTFGSDTLANSGGADSGTERTNAKGIYTATVTEAVAGWCDAKILDGSGNLIATYVVFMVDDTNTHRCCELGDVYAFGGAAATATGGRPEVNTTYWGGTAVAAANVLIDGAITSAKFAAGAFDAVWTVTTRELTAFSASFKTGYALSSAGVQAVWDALTSALTTVGSVGKMLVDKLGSVSGQVASQTEVQAIQNNTRVVRVVPNVIERPDSGTTTYRIELLLYDDVGNMEAPDSAPTLDLVDQGGTDLSARLDSATGSLVSTGRYRWVYTASTTDDLEQLIWTFSVVEGGATRLYGNTTLIVDTTAVDFTSADRTKLEAIHTKLPSKSFLTGTTNSDGDVQIDESTGDFNATQQTRIQTQAAAAITAASLATASALATLAGKFTGITLLAQWLGAMAGKQTPDATALAEINATGAGSGTFADGDSLEDIKDGLPAGGGDATLANQTTIIAHLVGMKGASWAAGDNLKAIEDAVAALSVASGAGAFSVPLTIYQSGGVTLVPECDVILTTTSTSPSTNIYASGRTNASGVVTFHCDTGTYYIWRQKAGLNFSDNPKTLTVDGSGTAVVS